CPPGAAGRGAAGSRTGAARRPARAAAAGPAPRRRGAARNTAPSPDRGRPARTPAAPRPRSAPVPSPLPPASRRASPVFSEEVLQDLVVEGLLGDQPLEPGVFLFQRLEPRRLAALQPAVLALPAVE